MVCLTIGKGFPVDVIYSLSNRWERLPRGRHNYVFFLTDGKDFPVDVICNLSNRWERLSPWTLYVICLTDGKDFPRGRYMTQKGEGRG